MLSKNEFFFLEKNKQNKDATQDATIYCTEKKSCANKKIYFKRKRDETTNKYIKSYKKPYHEIILN